MSTRKSGPLDAMVGDRIRMFRVNRGMSLAMLAGRIGVTFQQVQKYERGANRSASAGWCRSPPCWTFDRRAIRIIPD